MNKQQNISAEEQKIIGDMMKSYYNYTVHDNKSKGYIFSYSIINQEGKIKYIIRTNAKENEIEFKKNDSKYAIISVENNIILIRFKDIDRDILKDPIEVGIIMYGQTIIKKPKEESNAENDKKAKKAKKRAMYKRMGFK